MGERQRRARRRVHGGSKGDSCRHAHAHTHAHTQTRTHTHTQPRTYVREEEERKKRARCTQQHTPYFVAQPSAQVRTHISYKHTQTHARPTHTETLKMESPLVGCAGLYGAHKGDTHGARTPLALATVPAPGRGGVATPSQCGAPPAGYTSTHARTVCTHADTARRRRSRATFHGHAALSTHRSLTRTRTRTRTPASTWVHSGTRVQERCQNTRTTYHIRHAHHNTPRRLRKAQACATNRA